MFQQNSHANATEQWHSEHWRQNHFLMTWWTCPPVGLRCFQKHHVNFSPAAVAKAPLPPLPLVEVIQMLPAAPRWVCTLFNEQRKQPARKWGLEDPLLHIKDTINWGQMKQCAGVCVYCVRVERHEGHYHKSMPLAYVSTYISIRLPWNQTRFFLTSVHMIFVA